MTPLPRAVLPLLALVAAACAEGPPSMVPAQTPPPTLYGPGDKGVSEVDSEMLAIGKAEDQIDRLFPNAGKERLGPKKADAEEASQGAVENEGCATACKALASMRRSADHLCNMTGEGDGRCEDARGRVRGAAARVRSVCPTCVAQP